MQKLTKEQALVITGYTGHTACNFGDFHQDVEKRLGRAIWSHQFADPDIKKEIKAAYRQDFLAMCDET